MIRLTRIVGFLLMGAGALLVATWVIKPLRLIWPWIRDLPFPIRLGVGAAALGLLVLLGSLIWERLEERDADRSLRDQ